MSDARTVRPHVDGQAVESTIYRDWEAAARASKWDKAVGEIRLVYYGRRLRFEIIKHLHRDGTINFRRSGVVHRPATNREIDGCSRWKPF